MLFMVLQAAGEQYAIAATHIVEVLPAVEWRVVSPMPAGVVGLLNYHGTAVPLVDLSLLFTGTPSPLRMGTRILITRTNTSASASRLALIAKCVIGTQRWAESDFLAPTITPVNAPYLGPVVASGSGFVQRIEIKALAAQLMTSVPEMVDA